MNFDQALSSIRRKFEREIGTEAALTGRIAYDNVEFTEPESGIWVRFTILTGDSNQASIGSPGANLYRNPGIVVVQLFIDIGKGDGDQVKLADTICKKYRDSDRSDGITYYATSITRVGRSRKWHQINVSIPYRFDDVN